MKKYPWLWASLLVVAAVACLWGRRWAGAATLTAEERAQCREAASTSASAPSAPAMTRPRRPHAAWNAAVQACAKCLANNNTPYTGCRGIPDPTKSCSVSVPQALRGAARRFKGRRAGQWVHVNPVIAHLARTTAVYRSALPPATPAPLSRCGGNIHAKKAD